MVREILLGFLLDDLRHAAGVGTYLMICEVLLGYLLDDLRGAAGVDDLGGAYLHQGGLTGRGVLHRHILWSRLHNNLPISLHSTTSKNNHHVIYKETLPTLQMQQLKKKGPYMAVPRSS